MQETNVTKMLEWYEQKYPLKKRKWQKRPPLPHRNKMNPSLKKRRIKMTQDPRFLNVRGTGYFNLRGIVVHESLNLFRDKYLPFLHLRIGENYRPALLWYVMRWRAFQSIIECCDIMASTYPQIEFYYEKLVCDALECLESHLRRLYNQIISRLERNQKLEEILSGYIHFVQEETHFVIISGLKIYFKPDWLQIGPEFMYLTDFKSGTFNKQSFSFEKNRLQALLYAFFLEFCYFPKKVIQVTVHYLGNNKRWDVTFSDTLREETQEFVRKYCISMGIQVPINGPLISS